MGDAIGAHFEGKPASLGFEIPLDLRVTDDTQLTLATCEAIVEVGTVQPERIAQNFVRWFRERRLTGMGASTLKSLTELEAGGHWAMVGATGEHAAGNGAAMRIAPLAFMLDPNVAADRQTIRDVCRITHRHDEAYIGALAIVRSIRYAMLGKPLQEELLHELVATLPDSRVRDRLMDVCHSSLAINEYVSRFSASGYVVDSVPLAILAALRSTDLLSTMQQIVLCGGDTDTIASMFGQIYGASVGADLLPTELLNQIDSVSLIRETAIRFANTITKL